MLHSWFQIIQTDACMTAAGEVSVIAIASQNSLSPSIQHNTWTEEWLHLCLQVVQWSVCQCCRGGHRIHQLSHPWLLSWAVGGRKQPTLHSLSRTYLQTSSWMEEKQTSRSLSISQWTWRNLGGDISVCKLPAVAAAVFTLALRAIILLSTTATLPLIYSLNFWKYFTGNEMRMIIMHMLPLEIKRPQMVF